MRPSNSGYALLLIVFLSCNQEDVAPTPDLVQLNPVSEITANTARLSLEIVGTLVQLSDTTFLIDGKKVKEVGFAYTTDPRPFPDKWENISIRPTSSTLTADLSALESGTRYYVSAFVHFNNDNYQEQMQYIQFDYSNDPIEFVTLE